MKHAENSEKSKHEVLVDSLVRTTQMYLHISVYNCDTVQWRTVILIFPALQSIVCSMLEWKNSHMCYLQVIWQRQCADEVIFILDCTTHCTNGFIHSIRRTKLTTFRPESLCRLVKRLVAALLTLFNGQ